MVVVVGADHRVLTDASLLGAMPQLPGVLLREKQHDR